MHGGVENVVKQSICYVFPTFNIFLVVAMEAGGWEVEEEEGAYLWAHVNFLLLTLLQNRNALYPPSPSHSPSLSLRLAYNKHDERCFKMEGSQRVTYSLLVVCQ